MVGQRRVLHCRGYDSWELLRRSHIFLPEIGATTVTAVPHPSYMPGIV